MRCQSSRRNTWFLVPLLGSGIACGDEGNLTVPPTTGTLEVTAATTGVELDPDGYTVQVDADLALAIGPSGTLQIDSLEPRTHTVQLGDIAPNCTARDNPRSVAIVAGETTTVEFTVACAPTTGRLQITASTSGSSPYQSKVMGPKAGRTSLKFSTSEGWSFDRTSGGGFAVGPNGGIRLRCSGPSHTG